MERSVLSAILASAFVICLSAHAADDFRGWSLQNATNRAVYARSQVREDDKGLHISLNRADWTNPAAGWIGLEPPQGDRRIVHPDGTIRVIFRTSSMLTCGEAGFLDKVLREGHSLEVKVFEDDGEGPDGHLSEIQPLIFH